MREYTSPLMTRIPDTGNLTDDIVLNAREAPQTAVFSHKVDGDWVDVTAATFLDQVQGVAKGLMAVGLAPGDRVALISKTRYEWTLLDYSFWYAGLVTVPVYETSSADQMRHILADSGARAVLVETAEHLSRLEQVRADLPDLHHVWTIEDGAVDLLTHQGRDVADDVLEERRTLATPLDLATIIYTSGTTGEPKGCMLTHGNFMCELGVAVDELDVLFHDEASSLLFLPLAHVFARIIQIGAVKKRVRLAHSSSTATLAADLADFAPTFVLAVPRVFEKVFNTASQRAAADGKGAVFDRATTVAIEWSRALESGGPGPWLRVQHALYRRLVYTKLQSALGGDCRHALSGGAPLGERLGHFYRGIGMPVLEGYGMTETTAALTVNLPDAHKVGTVGRPLGGTTVRVAEDGELVVKGGQVFAGYWEDEDATRELVDRDGWLHTGDIAEIDDEGFVRITGRKKEIIVTAGGKNVAPAALEDRLRSHLLIDQCMVVGDGQPFIAALITLDPETVPQWAEQHGKSGTVAQLVEDPDLRAEIEVAVGAANASVSRAESIRKYAILPGTWTEEGGQLTPSLKLRRSVVLRECREDVEALYLP